MSLEFAILGAAGLVTSSAAVQHFNTVITKGIAFVFTDRSTPLQSAGFSGRAERTLRNNMESAAMFVPPALVLLTHGDASTPVSLVAIAYLLLRVTYTLSYWLGLSRLRSLSWGLGMACILFTLASASLAALGLR